MSKRPQPSFHFRKDASKFPLIRDILGSCPQPSSSTDSVSWLSEPSVTKAVRKNMPDNYLKQEKILLDRSGQLLVWGVAEGTWKHCLKIDGLRWETLRSDLDDLFVSHDIVDPPIVVGNRTAFMALVYMKSLQACENAIADLDGAEVGSDIALRVAFATSEDLRGALEIQG